MKKLEVKQKMYVYNVGYHSYEESEYCQLYHEKKFNQKEFEDIVIEAAISVLKESEHVNNYKDYKHEGRVTITFQDIFFSVVEVLVKKFGFKEVKFTSGFNVFGWADILDPNDWKIDRCERLNKLTKRVRNALKAKNKGRLT